MSDQRQIILAIDDTPENLSTLGAVLSAEFRLQVATSGAMGLALAMESPPDLILLDVMMPEMDGYETCRRFKAAPQLKDIPVIFVTALSEVEAESAGLTLGAVDYITKPFNVAIARQRIRNLLEREQLRKKVEADRDLLEVKVAERTLALSIAKEAAEAANRAKNTFLLNMSHELHTPMNGIMGMTQLLIARSGDAGQKERLEKVLHASRRLLGLLDKLLDLSKMEAERLTLEPSQFRLTDMVENLRQRFEPVARERNLDFAVEVPEEALGMHCCADATRLSQILGNLIDNAIKFTEQGKVTFRILLVGQSSSGIDLRFEVEDTGIGIAAGDQERIFKAFEQADGSITRKYQGAGLGLAICRRLARLMGSDISVASREAGEGSVFRLTVRLEKGLPQMGAIPVQEKVAPFLDETSCLQSLAGDQVGLCQPVKNETPDRDEKWLLRTLLL